MVAVSGDIERLGVIIIIITIPSIITALRDVALRIAFPVTNLTPTASFCAEDSILRVLYAVFVAF